VLLEKALPQKNVLEVTSYKFSSSLELPFFIHLSYTNTVFPIYFNILFVLKCFKIFNKFIFLVFSITTSNVEIDYLIYVNPFLLQDFIIPFSLILNIMF
jgi:hypothetical protein